MLKKKEVWFIFDSNESRLKVGMNFIRKIKINLFKRHFQERIPCFYEWGKLIGTSKMCRFLDHQKTC